MTLPISERIAAWKRNSCVVPTGQPCMTELPIFEFWQPENAIPDQQQIDPIAEKQCPYLNISHSEKAFPDN